MNRLIPLTFALLTAAGAAADSADVRTAVAGPAVLHPGEILTWTAAVENAGPDAARNVHFSAGVHAAATCSSEVIPLLAAGERRAITCSSEIPPSTYIVQMVAYAHAETPDPDPENNLVGQNIDIVSPPDLQTFINAPHRVDRAAPFEFMVLYRNRARAAATGVTLTVTASVAIVNAPEYCTVAGNTATCSLGTVAPDETPFDPDFDRVRFTALSPDASEAPVTLQASIRQSEEDAEPRDNEATSTLETHYTIYVTNANDSGAGSLRAAIEEANAGCRAELLETCKIDFRISPAAARWITIRPETPLPAVTVDRVVIDGLSQTRFADTNPLGPELEISGELLTDGNGITLTPPCTALATGLAINGFPGNGVFLGGAVCGTVGVRGVAASYIGTDPTGTRAVPNLRGVMIDVPAEDWLAAARVDDSVISGNRRAGIWVASGRQTRIRNNAIGLTPGGRAGLGNGASGVYIAAAGSGTDVIDNYIGFNADAGIALDPNAVQVEAASNSFQANGSLAIDHGLDGVTPIVPDVGERPGNRLHAPVLTLVRYDAPTDTTIVEGAVDVQGAFGFRSLRVAVYANAEPDESGFGEGQYLLGYVYPDTAGRFRFVHRGRTPGRWIAATANSYHLWGFARAPKIQTSVGGYAATTSEFSRTVEVSQ